MPIEFDPAWEYRESSEEELILDADIFRQQNVGLRFTNVRNLDTLVFRERQEKFVKQSNDTYLPCASCKKYFRQKRNVQLYCSLSCRPCGRPKVNFSKPCLHCGKMIAGYGDGYVRSETKFCSRDCGRHYAEHTEKRKLAIDMLNNGVKLPAVSVATGYKLSSLRQIRRKYCGPTRQTPRTWTEKEDQFLLCCGVHATAEHMGILYNTVKARLRKLRCKTKNSLQFAKGR